MTRLLVEPARSSPIHDWLSSELEQCGFDGNYTSRCVFNIVDRQTDSEGPRIGSCPTMSLWAWDQSECAPRPSSAALSEVGSSSRHSWNGSSDEDVKKEAVVDLLRLMVSTEVCIYNSVALLTLVLLRHSSSYVAQHIRQQLVAAAAGPFVVCSTSSHDTDPPKSFWNVLHHAIFWRHILRLPSAGVHVIAALARQ